MFKADTRKSWYSEATVLKQVTLMMMDAHTQEYAKFSGEIKEPFKNVIFII